MIALTLCLVFAAPVPADDTSAVRIVVWTEGKVVLLRPDGTEARAWEATDIPAAGDVALSPDRTRVAVGRLGPGEQSRDGRMRFSRYADVAVYDLQKLAPRVVELPGTGRTVRRWSPDGGTLFADVRIGKPDALGAYAIDTRTWAAVRVPPADPPAVPDGHAPLPDGVFAGGRLTRGPDGTYLVPAGGGRPVRLTEPGEAAGTPLPSPDGRRLVFTTDTTDPVRRLAVVFDVAAGKRTRLAEFAEGESLNRFVWSPDGKRLLFVVSRTAAGDTLDLQTIDANGANRKTIRTLTVTRGLAIDWR